MLDLTAADLDALADALREWYRRTPLPPDFAGTDRNAATREWRGEAARFLEILAPIIRERFPERERELGEIAAKLDASAERFQSGQRHLLLCARCAENVARALGERWPAER